MAHVTEAGPRIAAIFDMDGVLIDSVAMNWRAINDALLPYRVSIETGQVARYVGRTLADQMLLINRDYGLCLRYDTFVSSVTEAREKRSAEPAVKEGAVNLLRLLKDSHIPRAVATSTARSLAEERLGKSGLLPYFETIVTADDVAQHKPAPDVYLRASDELGALYEDCVVFEDAPSGVEAAKRAGMKCIAVRTPYVDPSHLSEADLIVESLALVNKQTIGTVLSHTK